MAIAFTLNGRTIDAGDADPHQPLLHFLRGRGLTGTKEGCAEGECGACAVVLVTRDAEGRARYQPVNSCLLLLGSVAGHEVLSVEGLAQGGELHPVQEAMVKHGGSQCGYCTPGFVMSLFAEYHRPGREAFDLEAISGNLCRCTGYRPIRDAAASLPMAPAEDPFQARLKAPPPELALVELANGKSYFRPTALADVFRLQQAHPAARLVAGGTDVVVDMNQRGLRFDGVISLENVAELLGLEWGDTEVRIGAGVSLSDVEHFVQGRLPMLEQLLPLFSSRLIRNRATFGGNLATASPIGDGPPALLALDAEVEIESAKGARRVPLASFFKGYRKTELGTGEVLKSIFVPLPLPRHQRFYKVSKRKLDDISTVAAAFALTTGKNATIESVRLAFGGVAATPVRATEAERALTGKPWNTESVVAAAAILSRSFSPIDDHRGSAAYRRAMISELFRKFAADTQGGAT